MYAYNTAHEVAHGINFGRRMEVGLASVFASWYTVSTEQEDHIALMHWDIALCLLKDCRERADGIMSSYHASIYNLAACLNREHFDLHQQQQTPPPSTCMSNLMPHPSLLDTVRLCDMCSRFAHVHSRIFG